MPDGFVQLAGPATGSSGTGTTQAVTVDHTIPVGDWVIGIFEANAADGTSCADTGSNTYNIIATQSTSPHAQLFAARMTTALVNTNTITVTSGSSGGRALCLGHYTGVLALVPATDQTGSANFVTGTSQTVTAAGANLADRLVVSGWGMGGATTSNAASGYTLEGKGASTGTIREAVLFDKIVAAVETSSCNHTWTTSVVSSGLIATFKLQPRLIGPQIFSQAVRRAAVM